MTKQEERRVVGTEERKKKQAGDAEIPARL